MGGDSKGHWRIINDGKPMKSAQAEPTKPPYIVPLMQEIRQIPWNGLKVASTFSGAGGSCTGYRMAGYKVVWANEFVPIAQESYKANAAESSILDGRDIKQVTASDILEATGLSRGELDLFDGSPPCQAFSTAGKREKGWGSLKKYEHGATQKNEELFFDYIRLLDGLSPKTFVAENVSGLVKGTAKGFFIEILKALRACGYKVEAKLLDAQWLGVPQTRQRIIFIGVREDLGMTPVFPKPLPYRYSVREAMPWIDEITLGNPEQYQKPGNSFPRGERADMSKPLPCVQAFPGGIGASNCHDIKAGELKVQSGAYPRHLSSVDRPSPAIVAGRATAIEQHGVFNEGVRATSIDDPAPTVCSIGMGAQRMTNVTIASRKFTIQEIKRLCSFPDDFELKGSYSQQWERLGNSVPPVMMYHVASTIRDHILLKRT